MDCLRRSTRIHGSTTRRATPRALSDAQPVNETAEMWISPLSSSDQIAVHSHLPSITQTPKFQTATGSWVTVGRQTNGKSSTSTVTPGSASSSRTTPNTTLTKRKRSPSSSSQVSIRRKNSDDTVALCDSDATISAQSSRNTSRTVSKSPPTPEGDPKPSEAVVAMCMLQNTTTKPMSVAQLQTPFVDARQESLERYGAVMGHYMSVQTSCVGREGDIHKKTWEIWVEESAVRESLKREAEYREKTEGDEKRRKKMGAMLEAFKG